MIYRLLCVVLAFFSTQVARASETVGGSVREAAVYRGPLDTVLIPGSDWCLTCNELSGTVSLIDLRRATVVDEIACGERPCAIAGIGDGQVVVSCREDGTVQRIAVQGERLKIVETMAVGYDPQGIAFDANHQRAFVGLVASGEIAVLNLKNNSLERRFPCGNWPRTLALSPNGERLAVGLSGDSSIAVHDTETGELLYDEPLSGGINIGHMQCSRDGLQVYFPWMVYRSNPITASNIQRGWVLASRVARVRLDGPSFREAISLDVPREAVADPFGLAISPDESRMVVSSSGTHELLVYRLKDLPFVGTGGPGDLIDRRLMADNDLFFRMEVGGRPMAVRALDDRRFVVANHTLDSLQIVDIVERSVLQSISLGSSPTDAQQQEIHLGRELFHDARRSLDQWYSCNSCHLDGGSNAKAMDTWNDGTELTSKTVLPLQGVIQTGPWTWHGWQEDFRETLQNSFTSTMQGKAVSDQELRALKAYLESLKPPRNPFRSPAGELSESAERGKLLFESSQVGCADCHSGPSFTDGQIHDVGLGSESDHYAGYNTPSLIGVHRKVRLLHDGRAKSLERVLSKYHLPEEIGGGQSLDEGQLADLIEYLKSL